MKTIEQIALEVAAEMLGGGIRASNIGEGFANFAHRFLAEWKKQQVPVAWMDKHKNIDHGWDAILDPNECTPLYTLNTEEE